LPNKDDIWKKVDAETKNEFIHSKYYLIGILKQKIVILFSSCLVTMAMAGHNGNGRSQWQWQVTMAMAGHNGNGRSQWQWQVTMAMAGQSEYIFTISV
jgi:hypothetical protein